jgi:hypothetical protein
LSEYYEQPDSDLELIGLADQAVRSARTQLHHAVQDAHLMGLWQTTYQLPDEQLSLYVISHYGRVFYSESGWQAGPGMLVTVNHGPHPTDTPVPPSGWIVAPTATEVDAR